MSDNSGILLAERKLLNSSTNPLEKSDRSKKSLGPLALSSEAQAREKNRHSDMKSLFKEIVSRN